MRPITILLSEGKTMVRQALRGLLETDRDFLIVGEAADASDVIILTRNLSPQVVLLDSSTAGFSARELFENLRRRSPWSRLIVLSTACDKQSVVEALRWNVAGFVFKTSGYETLANAIRTVAAGGLYIPVTLSESDLRIGAKRRPEQLSQPDAALTLRQHEVLRLVACGFTNREIGFRLSISPRTVEVHRAKLRQKLALRDRAELVRFAFRGGTAAHEELPNEIVLK